MPPSITATVFEDDEHRATHESRLARHVWFKSVILPHESALRAWLRRNVTAHDIDMDDVVSESLIRAYQVSDFDRIKHGRAFLFTITRHLLIDIARQRSVVSFDLVANIESHSIKEHSVPSPEVIIEAQDELRLLQRVVEALPPRCREVFILRRVEGLAIVEIAGRLQLSVSTVEKHLAKSIALVAQGMATGKALTCARP